MLRLLKTLTRVLVGFLLACLVAGIVTVLFVDTPNEIAALPTDQLPMRSGQTLELALLTATHSAIFAAVFVLIAAGLAEWLSIRSLPYFLLVGTAIAMLGFMAQYQSEVAGQPTILNNYALKAFMTAGFFSGFIFWLFSGQFSGQPFGMPGDDGTALASSTPAPVTVSPSVPESKQRLAEIGRKPEPGKRRVSASVTSRIIDITADTGTKGAIVSAVAAKSAYPPPLGDTAPEPAEFEPLIDEDARRFEFENQNEPEADKAKPAEDDSSERS